MLHLMKLARKNMTEITTQEITDVEDVEKGEPHALLLGMQTGAAMVLLRELYGGSSER